MITFEIGALVVHKGVVCRVDVVDRHITGVTRPSLAYMGIADGSELNPDLTLMPLYALDGTAVKKPKPRVTAAGAVCPVDMEAEVLAQQITKLTQQLRVLRPPTVQVDPDVVALLCECHECPKGCTCFEMRVTKSERLSMESNPSTTGYTCPRGHGVCWEQVRATAAVDSGGYTIDRNHPLWQT